MSEELTPSSLRVRVSNAALHPDVKKELFKRIQFAHTPEALAAIEAQLTSAAPAPPTFKPTTAETREYRARPYSLPRAEARSAEPPPELAPWQIIELLMDERDAFAVEKPSKRRPFTKAAFREVVREVQSGPNASTQRARVERAEALGDTLRAYADNHYSQRQQVSDQNKALFAAAVAEFYDQINRYLSAAQPFIALEGAPKIKTAPSSRAVLSEEDPRFVEAEQARKKQPTAPSPFATQAKPLARARRSDVMRTVGEKGRLLNLFRKSAEPARFAAVLVRFNPYGFGPENKSRRKRGGPMPTRPSIYDPDTIAEYVQNVGTMLEQYKESADVYYDTTEQAATTPRAVASVNSARRAFADSFRQAQANYAKAQGLMEQLDAVYPQIDELQASQQPSEATDKKIEKLFAQAQAIYDKIERISGQLMGQFGVPMSSSGTDDLPRENVDDFALDIGEEIEDAYPDWLVDAVFLRYVCMYPMTLADAKDLIYKHRSTFAATQDKFLKRPVVADVNVHGHFIIDVERLFRPKNASIAQDVAALIDNAFMVDVPRKGFQYIEQARVLEAREFEKAQERRAQSIELAPAPRKTLAEVVAELPPEALEGQTSAKSPRTQLIEAQRARDDKERASDALQLTEALVRRFDAERFVKQDWAGTQPSTYAEIKFEDKLKGARRGAEPIRKFLLDEAPKAVESVYSTTPTVLLQDTIVAFLKQIRANFRPSAPNLTKEQLKEELLDYVRQLSAFDVPVVNEIRNSGTRNNADESADPTDTAEPFAAIEDVQATPEKAVEWSTLPPSQPPESRPTYAAEFFINDWLNNNQNFFGLILNSVVDLDKDVFSVFGPHNVVTIAQYYNEYKLLPRSVGADYLEPDESDEPEAPRTIIMRIDYDNVKSPIEVQAPLESLADEPTRKLSYPRAFRDLLQATPEEGVQLVDVLRVQFIWPFASEPIPINVDQLIDGEYDDLFGEVVSVFLERQFDQYYEQSDAVIKTIMYDLHQRMEQLDAVAEDVAPRVRNYIGTMYKMTGRIAAINTWSQNTFINVLSGWLDDLAEDPRKKEPWWLPYLVPNYAEILGQSNPLAAFKDIDFERRRDEVSAAWKKEHDVASDTLALSAAQAGFMHVPTAAVGARRGARVVAAIDPENKTVAWGQRKPLQVLSDEDYAARGFPPELTAQWMDPERSFFTRTSVEAAPHAFVTVPTEVFERRVPATARYKVFDEVLDRYRELAKPIGDVMLRSRQQYENIDALIHAIDDPESILPRWDVPVSLAASAKSDYAAGRKWAGLNLNKRAVLAARGLDYLKSALTEVDPEVREKAAQSYATFINDTVEPLNAATVETLRAEIEPRMVVLHGSDPAAAVTALEELYQLAADHPNNMVYTKALAFLGLEDVVGGREPDAELPDDFGEPSAEELAEDEKPRENRGKRSRKPASAPRRKNRNLPPPPALSPVETRQVEQLRQGPAMLLRQSVVAHMDKAGGTVSASALKEAFRKAVANLVKRNLLDTSTGQAVLTDRGRHEEVALIRQMLKQRKMLRQIVEGYDRYVRLATARANATRQIGEKIKEVARQVPPPRPTPLPQRDNPSGFALSGKVTTRRMFDPRQGIEVQTPVVEYRPQVFQDPPTFKKGSRQHQNRQRTQPPYRPRIYLPVDPDHPTTQAFFEDTSRPTHDVIRQTLDWATHEHAAGTNVDTYAPDELIPMGRKWRGAGPRGAVVKPRPITTRADMEREARQQAKEVEKARKTLAEQEELVKKAQERIALGKKPTSKQQAALDAAGGATLAPPPAAPPRPASRPSTPVLTPVAMPATVSTVALPSVDDDEFVTPASEAEIAAMFEKYQDAQLAQMREQNEMLRQRLAGSPQPATTPKPAAKPVAELETPPAEGGVRRRRKQATEAAPEVEVDTSAYFVPAAVAAGQQTLPADNLDIELGLAMTEREQGFDADYTEVVTTARKKYAGRFTNPSKTNAARQKAAAILVDVAEGKAMNFDALRPYASPQTIARLNTLPPEAVQIAAQDMANLLRTLVSRPNSAKVVADHNDGSSAYGPRFQGFRVR
jgi:hypothetical protein